MENSLSTRQAVEKQLLSPGKETRGYTRWWWYGCAVDREEIRRELDEMLDAGIGGVELQILYPVWPDDEDKGIKNQFYLSPGYFESIRFACEEAKKRGMKFDLTLGSSWPYGGPFVPAELSAPNVIPYMIDVKGPCRYRYDFTTRLYGECVGCIMGRMENCQMIPESIVDITDQVIDKYLFNWEWGKELTEVEVPEGDYKIVIFISNDKRQTVLKPLPNGDGLIIDHNSKEALRYFLKNAGDPIAERLGNDMIQSYFCDSIEVFGQNWTNHVYEEFRSRRGYELRPYIYALWGEVKGITDRIRYDFQKTLGELTVENFFEELTKWCHEKGCTSRIQAHGTWGDILKAYGAADIPEGETFSAFDRYEVNTIHRKLASSAGHVYHKPLISNESFTWLRFPRFVVTLENIKAAVDSIFLDGMNQIVNHGYSYSPPDSGKLGWPFYASTQINHKNTWWPFYKHIGTYINRVCEFLRRGKTKVKLAIYLPQADIWAENPLSDIHMCMKLEERMTTKVVDGIHKEGYWFDYVNDDVLANWDSYSYEALLLIECERIPEETAKHLKNFAQAGHKIICKGRAPSKSCGLIDFEEKTENIKKIFESLCRQGRCLITEDSLEGILDALPTCILPDVQMQHHKDTIGYVHQVDGDTDIYFISNISNEWKKEKVIFSDQVKEFVVFDPMKAEEKALYSVDQKDKQTVVELELEPFQSLLFVFSTEMEKQYYIEEPLREERLIPLSENWTLTVEEKEFKKEYRELQSWEKEEALKYYSGEGRYYKEFHISMEEFLKLQRAEKIYLDLEHLGEAADVYLNGTNVGCIFMHPYRLGIPASLLRQGENTLEIRVRNLLINCAIDPSCQEDDLGALIIEQWPYTTERLNQGRQERVLNWRERDMIKEPVCSGLWGEISISLLVGHRK